MSSTPNNYCILFANIIVLLTACTCCRSRLPLSQQHQAIALGRRYTGEEALEAKIINKVCPAEELRERAIEAGLQLAGKDGLSRNILASIKSDMYRDTYRSLMEPVRFYSNL